MNAHSDWRTSSYSPNGSNCVEVRESEFVDVRDAQNREAGSLTMSPTEWAAFLAAVKSAEL
ncbi:hypothetical protein GCM10027570_40790 [Streptomonospora sediminis]